MIFKIYPSYRNESNECTPSNIFTLFRRIPLVGNLHASATFSVYNHIQNIAESYAQILQLLRAGLKFRSCTVLIITYLITIFTHPLERGEKIILEMGLKIVLKTQRAFSAENSLYVALLLSMLRIDIHPKCFLRFFTCFSWK